MDTKPIDPKRRRIELAVGALKGAVDRFCTAALANEATSRMKMLEESITVAPAMEEVVKAVTGREF